MSSAVRGTDLDDVNDTTTFAVFKDAELNLTVVAAILAPVTTIDTDTLAAVDAYPLHTQYDTISLTAHVSARAGRLYNKSIPTDELKEVIPALLGFEHADGRWELRRFAPETALCARRLLLTLLSGPSRDGIVALTSPGEATIPRESWLPAVRMLHLVSTQCKGFAFDAEALALCNGIADDLWLSLGDLTHKQAAPRAPSFAFSESGQQAPPPPRAGMTPAALTEGVIDAQVESLFRPLTQDVRTYIMGEIVTLMKQCVSQGGNPDREGLARLPGAVRVELLAKAGIGDTTSPAMSAFQAAQPVGHPAMPKLPPGTNPHDATAAQIRDAAKGFVGGGQSFANAAGMAHPGAILFYPELAPMPSHHLAPTDLVLPNHFLFDPSEPAAKLAADAMELVPTTTGFVQRATKTKLPELKSTEDLLIGGERLGDHQYAHGRFSLPVKLAHSKFLAAIVRRQRVQGYPWYECKQLEAKYRLGMHFGRYTAWDDSISLLSLAMTELRYQAPHKGTAKPPPQKRVKKQKTAPATKEDKRPVLGPHTKVGGKAVCFNWAKGLPCHRDPCIYAHACPRCAGAHQLAQCKEPEP